ncbi:zinc finger CCCH domain-containing protein 54 [Corylus avellana]|uniref:zinc finger CCCH domain-containing protein 54 n=1 Tax=Corylus avellana TaxID=13451 RepID=UPI00286C4FAA|nr:zinc finger CCCH domain-containing protein 54 [Corylus avellana]
MLKGVNPGFLAERQFSNIVFTPADYSIDEAIFCADEFRMYAYKIKRCPRMRSHDWTECPYAHRGEKAQRRDPRKFSYSAVACPAFRMHGKCHKGDACEFAHGVFEYWLHPARYRTRACNAGRYCQRKVCFFAHTPEQLRSETKNKCHSAYRPRGNGGEESASSSSSSPVPELTTKKKKNEQSNCFDGVSEFLKSLSALKIRDVEEGERSSSNWGLLDSDLPHIDWISELVQ